MAAPAGAIGQWQSLPFPVRLAGIFLAGMAMIWLTRRLGGISVLGDFTRNFVEIVPGIGPDFRRSACFAATGTGAVHTAWDCSPKAPS